MKFLNNLEDIRPFNYIRFSLNRLARQINKYNYNFLPSIKDLIIGFIQNKLI